MIDDSSTLPAPVGTGTGRVSTLDQLASIREEEIRLSKQKSTRTCRAYRFDVQHFMRTPGDLLPETWTADSWRRNSVQKRVVRRTVSAGPGFVAISKTAIRR
jgi:hypothetical protein